MAGVPKGSVLGPTLWNILYDGILRLHTSEGTSLVAYADDLAIVVVRETELQLMEAANQTLHEISWWVKENHLEMAPQKTEAVLLIGRKRTGQVTFKVEDTTITPGRTLKYLGVTMDKHLKFSEHIQEVTNRATTTTSTLGRLLSRQGGAGENKRRILFAVAESQILYAASIWRQGLALDKNRRTLESAQRRWAIRICRVYSTMATATSLVLARTIPLTLVAEERAQTRGKSRQEKERHRSETIDKWQEQWQENDTKSVWTHELIPDIRTWVTRGHGQINHNLAQILSGHGCFQQYLHRIGKVETGRCNYCQEVDTAKHTIFECKAFGAVRNETINGLGTLLTPVNLISEMTDGETKWNAISRMIDSIMLTKLKDERIRQRN